MKVTTEEPTARFHFTRWNSLLMDFGVLFCVLLAAFLAFAVAIVIARADGRESWFAAAVTSGTVVYFVLLVRLHLKYRYIRKLDYVVSVDGVSVETGGSDRFIPWSDVEVAEYFPAASVFRLFAKGESRPIVLFTLELGSSQGVRTRRGTLAERWIRGGLADRLKRRWIPW